MAENDNIYVDAVIGDRAPFLPLQEIWITVQLMVKEIPRYRFGMTWHFFHCWEEERRFAMANLLSSSPYHHQHRVIPNEAEALNEVKGRRNEGSPSVTMKLKNKSVDH